MEYNPCFGIVATCNMQLQELGAHENLRRKSLLTTIQNIGGRQRSTSLPVLDRAGNATSMRRKSGCIRRRCKCSCRRLVASIVKLGGTPLFMLLLLLFQFPALQLLPPLLMQNRFLIHLTRS